MKLRLLIVGLLTFPMLVKADPTLLPVNESNLTWQKDEWTNLEGRKIFRAQSMYLYNKKYLVFS
jgi:hypothetical protein